MFLGYLDTLKAFGKLEGWNYFITPDEQAESAFAARLHSLGPHLGSDFGIPEGNLPAETRTRRILPEHMRHARNLLPALQDCAAVILKLPVIRRYDYASMRAALAEKKHTLDLRTLSLTGGQTEDRSERIITFLTSALKEDVLEEAPWYYAHLLDRIMGKRIPRFITNRLADLFPELRAGLFYLKMMEG